mgnify:CR=1 FL=1|jgi:hypothetical protein
MPKSMSGAFDYMNVRVKPWNSYNIYYASGFGVILGHYFHHTRIHLSLNVQNFLVRYGA